MKQDIILSTLFWKSFLEAGKDNAKKARNFLESDTIVVDKNKVILDEYKDLIKILTSNDKNHSLLSGIMQDLESNIGCEIVETDLKKRNLINYSNYESEYKIQKSWNGYWKLVLKSNDFNDYVNPDFRSPYRNEKNVSKVKGDIFDFRIFLKKFYEDSSYLEIQDPYLFLDKNDFEDVKYICKDFQKDIKIITRTKIFIKDEIKKKIGNSNDKIPAKLIKQNEFQKKNSVDQNSYLYTIVDDIKSSLLGFNNKIKFEHVPKENCRSRKIRTDYFELSIDHTLGNIDYTNNKKPIAKGEIDIKIVDL